MLPRKGDEMSNSERSNDGEREHSTGRVGIGSGCIKSFPSRNATQHRPISGLSVLWSEVWMKVQVVSYDPAWKDRFSAEADRIVHALSGGMVVIYHIGSTSIPGIYAKPIIDMLLEAGDPAELDDKTSTMAWLGYEAMGEFGIPGRRYFRKNDVSGIRIFQVHAFQAGSREIERHLAFRDYMIAHPVEAQRYSALKQRLAREYPEDIEAYMDGKDPYIQEQQSKALVWYANRVNVKSDEH
jgi:GrpB-like predicted nucleotidyltransferase (UPF0157 family)